MMFSKKVATFLVLLFCLKLTCETWTLDDSPIAITEDRSYYSLTIEAGVLVGFLGNYTITCSHLNIVGTKDDNIRIVYVPVDDYDGAPYGGGFHIDFSIFSPENVNISYLYIEGMKSFNRNGGAISGYLNGTINNSVFTNCSVDTGYNGGAIYQSSGSLNIEYNNFINCNTSSYSRNGGNGGAICSTGSIYLNANSFQSCAASNGGAVFLGGSSKVVNNFFTACQTFYDKDYPYGDGGAAYIYGNTDFANNTFTGNVATDQGSAIFLSSRSVFSPVKIYNSIFWANVSTNLGNVSQIEYEGYTDLLIYNCNIQRDGEKKVSYGNYVVPNELVNLINCIDDNPLWENLSGDDPIATPPGIRYVSPNIDKGINPGFSLPDKDFNNKSRIVGSHIDIGACEYQSQGGIVINHFSSVEISNRTVTWEADKINLYGDIYITNGGELIVKAPAIVNFMGNHSIYVEGSSLILDGTDYRSGYAAMRDSAGIVLTINDTTYVKNSYYEFSGLGGWGGIKFNNDNGYSSIIKNCIVKRVKKIRYRDSDNRENRSSFYDGSIYINNYNNLEINNSTIKNNTLLGGYGGGVYIYNSSPTLTNNRIFANFLKDTHNYALYGGGIFIQRSNPILTDNEISGNYAYGYGGGIVFTDCNYNLTGNSIKNNLAYRSGGGIYIIRATNFKIQDGEILQNITNDMGEGGGGVFVSNVHDLQIIDSEIRLNACKGEGGGIHVTPSVPNLLISNSKIELNTADNGKRYGNGGGIFLDFATTNIDIIDSEIQSNVSKNHGGGIYAKGNQNTAINILSSNINSNAADNSGGGLYLETFHGKIDSCNVKFNASVGSGGGIFYYNPYDFSLRNSNISNNVATVNGGGISGYGGVSDITNNVITSNISPGGSKRNSDGKGGGLYLNNSVTNSNIENERFLIIANTFWNNAALSGGAFAGDSLAATFVNNILWNNRADYGPSVFLSGLETKVDFFYNLVQGGEASFGVDLGSFINGTYYYNINENPKFISPETGNLGLNTNSPAIEKGSPAEYSIPGTAYIMNGFLGFEPLGKRYNLGAFTNIQEEDVPDDNEAVTQLFGNYPNPFRDYTIITFYLSFSDIATDVFLRIYNIKGQLVKSYKTKYLEQGHKKILWNGTNDQGDKVARGVYLFSLEVDKRKSVKKMVYLK
ncbi:MAG: right-handed parallel beta-helix repeat-containing protein [Candidatus Cloacimonetes bacterium]|nr:right-handed parallel beta-helix repeat-containing protein [Candidatus Cloacimonadota bacterium]